ncbi:MAG: rhodanese-like domain-containing protein [Candidatus Dormiibacterota bacterium]
MPTIDEVLERARRRLTRVEPRQAADEQPRGALLIDIRTEAQRAGQGKISGALVIDRTVLEWRPDPASPWRIAQTTDDQRRLIVICSEGCSSSLAAASLQDLGSAGATAVFGGFQARIAEALPLES